MMIGAESIEDAKELGRYSSELAKTNPNVVGVAAMASSFFKPTSAQELVNFIAPLALAAAPLPFKYYHIPSMTNIAGISMHEFFDLAVVEIPTFSGIKYTDTDLFDMRRCVQKVIANGDDTVEIFFGKDEILTAGLVTGATSAVGSTYNFMAGSALSAVDAYKSGNHEKATAFQDRIVDVVSAWDGMEGIPAQKAIMRMLGVELGGVRPPLTALSSEEEGQLRERLENLGFFKW
jgi:N-acetylneuraminate lyase